MGGNQSQFYWFNLAVENQKCLHPMCNRYKTTDFIAKIDDSEFVEADSEHGLPQLMAEITRWRTVIAAEYSQHALTTYKV